MEWYFALLLMVGALIGFMLVGLPVVFAFFAVNIVGALLFFGGEAGLAQLVRNAADSIQTFALLPIPLFVFMGEIMFHTGVAARAIDAVDRLIARIPGRLSLVAITGGTIFSSLSGSTIANTAMLGSALLPEMYRRGYKPSISIGPIVAVGGVAMLIPPSALAVLLGSVAKIPIGPLLIAAILPGLLLAASFFAYVIVRCKLEPDIAPGYDLPEMTAKERFLPFVFYVLPLLSIFVVVVGSIVAGFATPSESAALGAFASLAACAGYRKLSWSIFVKSVRQTLRITTMTLFIICGSITFSQLLSFSGATAGLSAAIIGADMTPLAILIGMLAILFVLGCFMDQVSMMMIAVPLYMPLIPELGFEPIWFGILMLMILEISLATPPFGLLLFVARGVAPEGTTMLDVINSVFPFILLGLAMVAVLIAWPELTLVLPSMISR